MAFPSLQQQRNSSTELDISSNMEQMVAKYLPHV